MTRSVCDTLISGFLCLRALDLHGLGIKELPKSIGKLIHLRYLNLSDNSFKELPNSITLLHNLQYLELYSCSQLIGLPRDMKKMVNLRHLLFSFWCMCDNLCYFSLGLGNLTNLHRLEAFVVPDTEHPKLKSISIGKKSNYARLSDLNSLKNLRYWLTIFISGSYQNMALDAEKANLKGEKDLRTLVLYWKRDYYEEDEMVLENLQPPAEITTLSIYSYEGMKLPTWVATNQLFSSLPHLTSITIHSCGNINHIPSFARLPSITSILFYDLPEVEYLESDFGQYETSSSSSLSSSPTIFFPSLNRVEIGHLHKLKDWGRSRAVELSLPCASTVHIYHCYVLESMPLCPNVEHLKALHVPEELQMLTRSSGASSSSGPKLENLEISTVGYLTLLPIEYLQKVSNLTFCLSCMPLNFALLGETLRFMNSLCSLKFKESPGLTSLSGLPLQPSAGLERLEFTKCNWTDDFINDDDDNSCTNNAWRVFKSLHFLKFYNPETMEVLPRGIQHVTTLQSLELGKCCRLNALPDWIGHLSSLNSTEITSLTNLNQLAVEYCPQLADKCQKETGEDWHK